MDFIKRTFLRLKSHPKIKERKQKSTDNIRKLISWAAILILSSNRNFYPSKENPSNSKNFPKNQFPLTVKTSTYWKFENRHKKPRGKEIKPKQHNIPVESSECVLRIRVSHSIPRCRCYTKDENIVLYKVSRLSDTIRDCRA